MKHKSIATLFFICFFFVSFGMEDDLSEEEKWENKLFKQFVVSQLMEIKVKEKASLEKKMIPIPQKNKKEFPPLPSDSDEDPSTEDHTPVGPKHWLDDYYRRHPNQKPKGN